MSDVSKAKVAAEIVRRIQSGSVIGVGSGSTVMLALQALGERIRKEKMSIAVVPTSYDTALAAERLGIQVLSPLFEGQLAFGFDGADYVDPQLRLIKGKGAAMLQEKILAKKCHEFVIIVDDSKLVPAFDDATPIPLEVVPTAGALVVARLKKMGAVSITERQARGKHGAVITEAGNIIFDVAFHSVPDDMEDRLKQIVGVVESGLFVGYTREVLVAGSSEIRTLRR
jgi:ribose 5-phosphate isomerase A